MGVLETPAAWLRGPAAVRNVASSKLALADVYRDHVDFVVRIARQLGIEAAHVEDVVHDVFLVVHRRLPDFDPAGSMRGWLYGITRRVAMHHQRGRARAARRERYGPTPVGAPDPETGLATAQAFAWIDDFLAQLDPDKRWVFVLADIEGLTAPEIATALGINVNTVYSRLRTARQRFERAAAQHFHSEDADEAEA